MLTILPQLKPLVRIELTSADYEAAVLPLNYSGASSKAPGGNRTLQQLDLQSSAKATWSGGVTSIWVY
jgi:hypothetical protein